MRPNTFVELLKNKLRLRNVGQTSRFRFILDVALSGLILHGTTCESVIITGPVAKQVLGWNAGMSPFFVKAGWNFLKEDQDVIYEIVRSSILIK